MRRKKKQFRLKFEYLNKNPHLRYEEDCAVRAMAALYDISWEAAYRKLFKTALKRKSTPSQISTVELALQDNGCTIIDRQNAPLIDYMPEPGRKILVLTGTNSTAHAIYVKDNIYYDAVEIDPRKWKISFIAIRNEGELPLQPRGKERS